MKPTLTLIILAASLFAADAPKPAELPAVALEAQLQIRTAQLQVARLSEAMTKTIANFNELKEKQVVAQAELEKLVAGLPKPKDCPACELTDALRWERPKVESAKK